jgi:hypothetical protein
LPRGKRLRNRQGQGRKGSLDNPVDLRHPKRFGIRLEMWRKYKVNITVDGRFEKYTSNLSSD